MKRVAIYLRVSTSKQDTDNQRRELEAVAERSGWKVVQVYEDAGKAFSRSAEHSASAPAWCSGFSNKSRGNPDRSFPWLSPALIRTRIGAGGLVAGGQGLLVVKHRAETADVEPA
jgi:hypothetical protein